jgi:hypothetical protein
MKCGAYTQPLIDLSINLWLKLDLYSVLCLYVYMPGSVSSGHYVRVSVYMQLAISYIGSHSYNGRNYVVINSLLVNVEVL